MSDPSTNVVQQVLADRLRQCIDFGLCTCTPGSVNPDCPCHKVQAIAITPEEHALAPAIIADDVAASLEEANPT